jgi:hypothetical protein
MAKMQIEPQDRVRVKLECLRMLVGLKLDPARTKLISGFVGSYLKLNAAEKAQFQVEVEQSNLKEEEKVMRILTDWEETGMQIEALTLVFRQLRRKLGPLPAEVEQQVNALKVEQLEDLGEALLDFSSLNDLTSWLQKLK